MLQSARSPSWIGLSPVMTTAIDAASSTRRARGSHERVRVVAPARVACDLTRALELM
jgi:hypothetical protein